MLDESRRRSRKCEAPGREHERLGAQDAAPSGIVDLYFLQLSRLYQPMRTLVTEEEEVDLVEHTTWVDLLRETDQEIVEGEEHGERVQEVEKIVAKRVSSRMFDSIQDASLSRKTSDCSYSVLADALPIGNGRCQKEVRTGLCDLCWIMLGKKEVETTRHLASGCPFSALAQEAVLRAAFDITMVDAMRVLTLATLEALVERRNQNTRRIETKNGDAPAPKASTDAIYTSARAVLSMSLREGDSPRIHVRVVVGACPPLRSKGRSQPMAPELARRGRPTTPAS